MSRKLGSGFACLYGLAMLVLCALPVSAQMSDVKAKPPMYTYVADWQIPRAHWGEMAQANAADKPILDKALADGTIVGYGNDEDLVHQADGSTHDDWWSATSMAGLIKVLDQFYASGNTSSPALDSATRHWDTIFISRYYNWHSGSYKGGYTSIASYKLKPDAPDDAVGIISEHMVAPLLEKMLADGTILEYEIDTLAVHTEAPGTFWISYVAAEPDGLDKVDAAIRDTLKNHPLDGPAFASMVDFSAHRDALIKGDGTYK